MKINKKFWGITAIIYGVFILASFIFSFYTSTVGGEMEWNWGLAIALAAVIYTAVSLHQVGPTELGARIFLGRPIDQVSSGFILVPFGFFKLIKETRLIIQKEFPDNPENIYRGEGLPPAGKHHPIRIPFGKPEKKDTATGAPKDVLEKDPLDMRLIEEVVPIVRFRISDYIAFLTVIKTVDEALNQLQDLCVSVLSEEFGKVTPAQVIADFESYNKKLTDEIQLNVETWGIVLESARIKNISFSHELNRTVQKIAEETALGKASVIKAEAGKKAAVLEGEGKGLAIKAELDGRTLGLKKMQKDLNLPSEVILSTETAPAITSNPGQKTIIVGSEGFKDLMAMGTALGESLKNNKE